MLAVGGVVAMGGCFDPAPPAGFTPPPDAVSEPGKVPLFVSRTENPLVLGRAPLRLPQMTVARFPSRGVFVEEMRYEPDGVRVRSTGYSDGVLAYYTWLDVAPREAGGGIFLDLVGNWPFRAPSVSLPFGGAPVELVLETVRGRTAESLPPGSIPPPLGFDIAEVDRIQYALDPDVLVLPVHVTVFSDLEGDMPYFENDPALADGLLHQWIDPGAATQISAARTDDGIQSRVQVHAALNDLFPAIAPDGIWAQCDIQFHLDTLEIVEQGDSLEDRLIAETGACALPPTPLGDYFPPGRDVDVVYEALPVFIGGTVQFDVGLRTTAGTCGAFNRCATFPRGGDDYIVLDGREAFVRTPWALAHELGHILGLGHSGSGDCEGDLEPTNLMPGAGPQVDDPSEITLSAAQCARARCLAGRFLLQWDRIGPARAEDLCAGF